MARGVPALLGQSLPPGWLSRGTHSLREVPNAAASRGWGPEQPRDEGPLWLQPHAAAPALCSFARVTARAPQGSPAPSPQLPPLCSACAQPGGAEEQLLSLSHPLSLSQPRCPPPLLLPLSSGGLSVPNRLLQPPRPRTGVNWGVQRGGEPRGHRGVTAALGPPSAPQSGLTPPALPAPPPVLFLKSSVLFQCRALCTVAPFLCTILAVQV